MKNAVRVISIVAAVFTGISLLALLVTTLFQRPISTLFTDSESVKAELPIIPIVAIVYTLLLVVNAVLVVVSVMNGKVGIWLDILLLVGLLILLPVLYHLASSGQTTIMNQWMARKGSSALMANSISNIIASYCLIPANFAKTVLIMCCGMNLAIKER